MNAVETALLDSLDDIGFERPDVEDAVLIQEYSSFSSSIEYRQLLFWLSQELKFLFDYQESIYSESLTHEDSFKMELISFLREIGYTETVAPGESSLLLIQHLCSEVMTGRILLERDKERLAQLGDVTNRANETVQSLVSIMKALKINPPPKGITAQQLFTVIQQKMAERIKAVPQNLVSNRAIKQQLGPVQFVKLEELNIVLTREYSIRRQMLLKRLDCTIESFGWTDRLKDKVSVIKEACEPRRAKLSAESTIGIPHLLAARDDILRYYKTSSSVLRRNTKSSLNKVVIGSVPDRGGRPHETAPPPEEMPAFKKREAQPPDSGGRGGGGFGRGRGGRVQDRHWQGGAGDNRGRGGFHGSHRGGGGYNQSGGYQQGDGYDPGVYQGGAYGQGGYQQGGEYGRGGYNRPNSGRGGRNQRQF